MKISIEYETKITWKQTGLNTWHGTAGNHHVATISRHNCGSLCTTWFEHYSDEQDNSITGDLKFLQEYIENMWVTYLHKQSKENKK